MGERLNITQFAERVKVSRPTIYKAIKSGRLEVDAGGMLEWESQERNWRNRRDPSRIRDGKQPLVLPGGDGEESESPGEGDGVNFRPTAAESLSKAKAAHAVYAMQLKKLEYEKESGKLIEKDVVNRAVFKNIRIIRDGVLTIPERVAAQQAAAIADYLKDALSKKLKPSQVEEIVKAFDLSDMEHITHEAWMGESRIVLEHISELIEKGIDFGE